MRAGTLRHRIVIQRATSAPDAAGQQIKTWATWNTVWAMIVPLQGRELVAAEQAQSETTVHIRIRYLDGLLTTDRVLWDSRYFAINGIVNPGERNIEMQLLCKEIV